MVQRVVDGDTIIVSLNGKEEKVRYIGMDTPELDPPECYGFEAQRFNRSLVEGKEVYLEGDEEDRDRYSRLLRYVWLAEGRMVNLILVEEGYARAVSFPPNIRYAERFKRAEDSARKERKGIWGACYE